MGKEGEGKGVEVVKEGGEGELRRGNAGRKKGEERRKGMRRKRLFEEGGGLTEKILRMFRRIACMFDTLGAYLHVLHSGILMFAKFEMGVPVVHLPLQAIANCFCL